MSMGHHVPTGFPVLILRPALRLGRVTVYDFEIHSKDDLLIISASATAWWRHAPETNAGLSPKILVVRWFWEHGHWCHLSRGYSMDFNGQ